MKAQAVSKAGVKIERLMEENRELTSPVKKLISIFQGKAPAHLSAQAFGVRR
jgi:hypothetical protein